MYLINYLNSGSLSINFKSQDTKKAPKVRNITITTDTHCWNVENSNYYWRLGGWG